MRIRALTATAAVLVAVTGCARSAPPPSLGDGSAGPEPTASASRPTAAPPGSLRLTRGSVTLTATPTAPNHRPVLDAYLRFFAAYADALARADAGSAGLKASTTGTAFSGFASAIAGNASQGVTVRGPVSLRPTVRSVGSATALVVDCLDTSKVQTYDRAGKPTGAVKPRPIGVQLRRIGTGNSFVVDSLGDGPATACERSGP